LNQNEIKRNLAARVQF